MNKYQETPQQEVLSQAHTSFQKGMHTHAFFKLQDVAVSADLVQNTFMKTWMYVVKGGKVNSMRAFLYHILNYLIVDEYRKRKTESLDFLIENGFEPSFDSSEKLFNMLDGKAALLLIHQLPEQDKKVMHMRYIQSLSLREISTLTGQSANAISVRLHRGIKKLRALYRLK